MKIQWLLFLVLFLGKGMQLEGVGQWSKFKANAWYRNLGWRVGCNFIPSTAENQLEMWQTPTFDPVTIERELHWVSATGMNTVRVYLHHLLWEENSEEFLDKIDQFLQIAQRYSIQTILVFLDDCWNPKAKIGPQPPPVPHVHNSRWLQSPGLAGLKNYSFQEQVLKPYVQGVIGRFQNDSRVILWDVYNEPGNLNTDSYNETSSKIPLSWNLLTKVFRWAREANPSQPLTSSVWNESTDGLPADIVKYQLSSSDIITFHNYASLDSFTAMYENLTKHGRPVICTEFMARPLGSTFKAILPFAKSNGVGAINWGWVSGKTQTIYPWDSWTHNYTKPPKVWFHDVLYRNGTAFDDKEIELIKNLTSLTVALNGRKTAVSVKNPNSDLFLSWAVFKDIICAFAMIVCLLIMA